MSDETTGGNEENILDYPSITDTPEWTKDLILDHIFQCHMAHPFTLRQGYEHVQVSPRGTKATKANLVAMHDRWHEAGNHGDGTNFKVPHKHTPIEVTEEQIAQVAAARNNVPISNKPLGTTERKVLRELVDNDFNALKSEMRQFAADALVVKHQEVEADWADRVAKAPSFGEKATDLWRKQNDAKKALLEKQRQERDAMDAKHEDAFKDLRDKAEKDGIEIDNGERKFDHQTNSERYIFKADAKGRKEALNQASAENAAMLNRGLMTLERQRLTAQRQVLVSGVSQEAASILDTVPKAADLMVQAQQKQSEITAQ